jgi:hypothetical protein
VTRDRVHTLLVQDQGAQLLDPDGQWLAQLDPVDPDLVPALRRRLPARASVQLVFATTHLTVRCQPAPRLSRRERAAVQQRLLREEESPEAQNSAQVLDPDPLAEGGHVLWLASQPRRELDLWLDALKKAGARAVFALPWPRAFLPETRSDRPGSVYLTRVSGAGHLLCFRGRALTYLRVFPWPEGLDPDTRSEPDQLVLGSLVSAELSRLLQFIRQKHRDLVLATLDAVGLPAVPALTRVAGSLGLELTPLEPDLAAFLKAGADRERRRKDGLDLIPEASRDSLDRRMARALVWTAAAGLILIGLGTRVWHGRHEASLEREAVRAEAARDRRRALAQEAEHAARQRFGLLRLRRAEQRQGQAVAQLERLGLGLFTVPSGVQLERLEILQLPGDAVRHRFTVAGAAVTRRGFSMGPLADYLLQLADYPGLDLEPLQEVVVTDRRSGEAPGFRPEQALTRFQLRGTAP